MSSVGQRLSRTLVVAGAGLLVLAGPITAASGQESLVGTFEVTEGTCDGDTVAGSHFKMVQPGGSAEEGPFVANGDSPCPGGEATPLAAGTDGGLTSGRHQGLDAIVAPATFFGTPFRVLTETPDGQTGMDVPAPAIEHDGSGGLTGDLRAWAVFYNQADYNQGSPKPDGSTPGITTAQATGTFDADTGAFTLEWVSTIEGGAFNNFSGVWHLEGTFRSSAEPEPTPVPTATTTIAPTPTATPTATPTPAPTATTTDDPTTGDTGVGDEADDTPDTGPVVLPALGLLGLAAAAAVRRRR